MFFLIVSHNTPMITAWVNEMQFFKPKTKCKTFSPIWLLHKQPGKYHKASLPSIKNETNCMRKQNYSCNICHHIIPALLEKKPHPLEGISPLKTEQPSHACPTLTQLSGLQGKFFLRDIRGV